MPLFQLTDEIIFPPAHLAEPDGLLAVGGDLNPNRLIAAYSEGIFPWYNEGDPLLWWFTDPRLVIFPAEFHPPKRLLRYRRKSEVEIRFDTAFRDVIHQCALIRTETGGETWIHPEMIEAYILLHHQGYAHSVEAWLHGELVGGLYGLALGKVFFGESMFSRRAMASQFALVSLVEFLAANGYKLIDCQMTTEHLLRFGAREITGHIFQRYLHDNITTCHPQQWIFP